MTQSRLYLVVVTLACSIGMWGCQPGPQGPPGPQGDPGPPVVFYVVNGPTKNVPASSTDIETLSCNAGDAAVSWAMEGAGLVAGPAASGHRTVIPVLTATSPTGFTFKYVCTTNPQCEITNRIVCAGGAP